MTRPKLLLADDSVTIRKVVELTFADEGIDVNTVADGEAAMAKFVDDPPDIVLVDVGLSEMSGYDICEIIKGDASTSHIPVLLLVGSFEPFDQDAAERSGADGFLTKPFHSIRDLVNRVHELLGTQQIPEPEDVVDFETTLSDDEDENDDINDLYQRSFAETVSIENFETVPAFGIEDAFPEEITFEVPPADNDETSSAMERIADDEPSSDDAPRVEEGAPSVEPEPSTMEEVDSSPEIEPDDEPVHSVPSLENDWLDDEMIEAVSTTPPEEIQAAEADAVQAVGEYEDAPAAAVDLEPIKEFDWSPAAMITATEENEIAAPRASGPSHEPVQQGVTEPEPEDHVTEEIPDLQTERIPELTHKGNGFVPEAPSMEITQELPVNGTPVGQAATSPIGEISPALIDMIVRRVVEQLSDRAVRDVAQEAVPRIAEKLMREALEEDRNR